MFVVLLKFSDNRSAASEHMAGHNSWLKQGFDDDVFLLAGSLETGQGGSVFAHNVSREALQERIDTDPFVMQRVVSAEVIEISPKMTDTRLEFLAS